jgi:two-component system OmpR family response regulator
MRILIAEDDQVLADGLLRSLRGTGYAVDQVGTGSEADAALAAHEFDLVILDLGLPKCTAWRCCADARRAAAPRRC